MSTSKESLNDAYCSVERSENGPPSLKGALENIASLPSWGIPGGDANRVISIPHELTGEMVHTKVAIPDAIYDASYEKSLSRCYAN